MNTDRSRPSEDPRDVALARAQMIVDRVDRDARNVALVQMLAEQVDRRHVDRSADSEVEWIRLADEAGMFDPDLGFGEIRPEGYPAPTSVVVRGEKLVYGPVSRVALNLVADQITPGPRENEKDVRWIKPGAVSLSEFLQVADGPAAKTVPKFAKRYGPLGLCRHGLAAYHGGLVCHPTVEAGDHASESLGEWMNISRRFRGIILSIARNRMETPPLPPRNDLPMGLSAWPTDLLLEMDRMSIYSYINVMFHQTGVRPSLWCDRHGNAELGLYAPNAYAALVLKLAAAVMGKTLLICQGCHRFFVQQSSARLRKYCPRPECERRAQWRDAQRAKRARDKKQRRTNYAQATQTRKS